MLRNRPSHLIALSLSSLALAAGAALPASASAQECDGDCLQAGDPTVVATGGTTVTRATLGPVFSVASSTIDQTRRQTLSQSASAEVVEDDGQRKKIVVECTASSFPSGVGTGIAACYLESKGKGHARYDAVDPNANPGPFDATVSGVITVPTDRYKVCVQSRTMFFDATFFEAPLVCS